MRADDVTRAREIEALVYLQPPWVPPASAFYEALGPLGLPEPPPRIPRVARWSFLVTDVARRLTVCAVVACVHLGAWKVVSVPLATVGYPSETMLGCGGGGGDE
jgi:hypothetical protein